MALNDNTRDTDTGGNGPATGSPTTPTAGGQTITPGFRDAINALYRKYYGRDATDAELQQHAGNPGGIDAVEAMLKASVPAQAPAPTPPPNQPPNPIGPSPGAFIAPPRTDLGGPAGTPPLPTFTGANAAPAFPTIPGFHTPTPEEALTDPGYKFVFDQGQNALQNWAAARGTLNDSGTANALTQFGQAAAGQQYKNVWDRDWQVYANDVNNNFLQPYAAKYRTWSDSVLGPAMLGYSTQAAAAQHLNDVDYQHAWDRYLQDINNFRDKRDTALNWTLQ